LLFRLGFKEWGSWFFDVEFFCESGDELVLRQAFSALVIVGCSEGEGISVEHFSVRVVVAGFEVGESLTRYWDAVYGDVDDGSVGPYGVGAVSTV
jgi:hypothetical protein